MADVTLLNQASTAGTYNTQALSMSSALLSVVLVDGLTVAMVADKEVWADGMLTYSITITNNAGYAYVAPQITDILDPTLVEFVADSVMVDDAALDSGSYTYTPADGTLAITLPDLAIGATTVVAFRVQKAA